MTDKMKHSRLFLWFIQVLRVCGRELLLVFRDEGVVIFFLLLNAVYPVLYALIYNPEVVRNETVVVVDDNRTAMSRELIRRMDATQEVAIVGYAANMQEAQECTARLVMAFSVCHATLPKVLSAANRAMFRFTVT